MTFIDQKATKGQLTQAVTPYPADNFSGCSFMLPAGSFFGTGGTIAPSGFPNIYSVGATTINSETQGFIQERIKTGAINASEFIVEGVFTPGFRFPTTDAGDVTTFYQSGQTAGAYDSTINVLYPDVLPVGLTIGTTIRGSQIIRAFAQGATFTSNPTNITTTVYLMSSVGALTSLGTNTISLGSITQGGFGTSDFYRQFSIATTPSVSVAGDRILVQYQLTGTITVASGVNPTSFGIYFGTTGSARSASEYNGCRPLEISVS